MYTTPGKCLTTFSKVQFVNKSQELNDMLARLSTHYGPTGWWPGDSPFEVAIGAILTQNTAWSNVEKAIEQLKKARLLTPRRMLDAPQEALETAIRSSGYYRQKAERLRIFCDYLGRHYRNSMAPMAARPLAALREELLDLKGIGPETADDILLYACDKPIFVVDAYTRRIFHRCGLTPETIPYDTLQQLVHAAVPPNVPVYKEFHGLIVWTGKDFCRKAPRCAGCPLARRGNSGGAFPCDMRKKTHPVVR